MDTPTPHNNSALSIGIIAGSTRPGRRSRLVAEWVAARAQQHLDGRASIVVLDLVDFALPLLDEPVPAIAGAYQNEHTRRWAAAVAPVDGFVFVTPEYNHSIPAALKNAVDYLFAEWNDKAAGIVTYGVNGGDRAAEHLRPILSEVHMATVRSQPTLSLVTDFDLSDGDDTDRLTPADRQISVLTRMFDELADWSSALREVRESRKR